MSDLDRKLATIEVVSDVAPIPGADAIEVATVRGWKVVVKKDEVAVGDPVVYFEIDSALPLDRPEFGFLAARGQRQYEGRDVHVLKTAKLRGQVSQGLALPLSDVSVSDTVVVPLIEAGEVAFSDPDVRFVQHAGFDVTDAFGVTKYEEPLPAELAGKAVGPFPKDLLGKTAVSRVQNLTDVYGEIAAHPGGWYATEKIDGESTTLLDTGNGLRLCSRNWELIVNEDLPAVAIARREDLVPEPGWAIQCELYGEGIRHNPLRVAGKHLAVFSVLRADSTGRFEILPREQWPDRFAAHGVPVLDLSLPGSVQDALDQAGALRSAVGKDRPAEGIVWHTADGANLPGLDYRSSMKAISDKYLVKHGL